jgi:excisionase family DNA binding protein
MENNTLDTSRKVVTLPEAANMLGVSCLTVRRAIENGKIEAIQINTRGRYRILVQEIDDFLKRNVKETDDFLNCMSDKQQNEDISNTQISLKQ